MGTSEREAGSVSVVCGRFDGPLDLLLTLVRRNKYPAGDLPIAEITRQFLDWVRGQGDEKDDTVVDTGGEFIETASWLLLLKSRTLLPVGPGEETAESEFRRVLLNHETMKYTAAVLEARLAESGSPSGQSSSPLKEQSQSPVLAVERSVADAVEAARRALNAAQEYAQRLRVPEPDRWTTEAQLAKVRGRLLELTPLCAISTEPWFEEEPEPEARVTLFLALLELSRTQEVLLHQELQSSPIALARNSADGHA